MSPWVRRSASRGGRVRSSMSFRGKRELLMQVAPRYSSARHGQRSVILDEFVAVTGYERVRDPLAARPDPSTSADPPPAGGSLWIARSGGAERGVVGRQRGL